MEIKQGKKNSTVEISKGLVTDRIMVRLNLYNFFLLQGKVDMVSMISSELI